MTAFPASPPAWPPAPPAGTGREQRIRKREFLVLGACLIAAFLLPGSIEASGDKPSATAAWAPARLFEGPGKPPLAMLARSTGLLVVGAAAVLLALAGFHRLRGPLLLVLLLGPSFLGADLPDWSAYAGRVYRPDAPLAARIVMVLACTAALGHLLMWIGLRMLVARPSSARGVAISRFGAVLWALAIGLPVLPAEAGRALIVIPFILLEAIGPLGLLLLLMVGLHAAAAVLALLAPPAPAGRRVHSPARPTWAFWLLMAGYILPQGALVVFVLTDILGPLAPLLGFKVTLVAMGAIGLLAAILADALLGPPCSVDGSRVRG